MKRVFLLMLIIAGVFAFSGDLSFKDQDYKVFKLNSLGLEQGVKVDTNGDGDIKDDEDYVMYSHIIFTDTYKKLSFRLLYIIEPPGTVAKIENFAGSTIKVRGKEYFVTSAEDYKLKLAGDFVKKKVYTQEDFSPETSLKFHGELKIGLDKSFNLYIVENNSLMTYLQSSEYNKGEEITYRLKNKGWDNKGYRIYVIDKQSNYVEVGVVIPGEEIEIEDGQNNVFGYAEVKINNDEFPKGSNNIIFLSDEYTIERGKNLKGEIKLDKPNYYYFKADFEKKKISARLGYIPKKTKTETSTKKKEFQGKKLGDYEDKIVELTGICEYPPVIKVDTNGDGDIYDEGDYVLYNKLYVYDGGKKAQVRLVYSIETEKLDQYLRKPFSSFSGKKLTIKGKEYTVVEVGEDFLVVGEELARKSIGFIESPSPEQATKLIENYSIAFGEAGNKKHIFLYRAGSLLGSFQISSDKKEITVDLASLDENLKKYRVIIPEYDSRKIKVAVVKADSTVKIADDSKAFGYELVRVNSGEIPDGRESIKFMSRVYTIERGDSVLLEEYPYYNLSYSELGYFKITRLSTEKKVRVEQEEKNRTEENIIEKEELLHGSGTCDSCHDAPSMNDMKAGKHASALINQQSIHRDLCENCHDINQDCTKCHSLPDMFSGGEKNKMEGTSEGKAEEKAEKNSFYGLLIENKDEFNSFMEEAKIPGAIKGFTTGRYIVHVDNETVGIVIQGGKIVEVKQGGIENPTSEIWTGREFIEKLRSSKDPIREFMDGQKSGEFRKEDKTIGQKVKSVVMGILLRLSDLFM